MTAPDTPRRKTRSSGTLQEKAAFAIALGLLFLLLPLLARDAPQAQLLRQGLLLPGLLALAIGGLLLALHRQRRRRAPAPEDEAA